jgi:hypothetical protein
VLFQALNTSIFKNQTTGVNPVNIFSETVVGKHRFNELRDGAGNNGHRNASFFQPHQRLAESGPDFNRAEDGNDSLFSQSGFLKQLR